MSGNTIIRPYDHVKDRKSFLALNFRTFFASVPDAAGMSEKAFREHHRWLIGHLRPHDPTRNTVLVAEIDGRYAGHCWLGNQIDFFTRVPEPWVFDLSVVETFRRRGVANLLLDAVEKLLAAQEIKHLGLQVMASNPAAQSLYRKRGYTTHAMTLRKPLQG